MDGLNASGPNGFEEQFRRMILGNGPQTAPDQSDAQNRPTVRLPPPHGQGHPPPHLRQGSYGVHPQQHSQQSNLAYHNAPPPPQYFNPRHGQQQFSQSQQFYQQRMHNGPTPPNVYHNAGRGRDDFSHIRPMQYEHQLSLDPTAFRRGHQSGQGNRQLFDTRSHGPPQTPHVDQRVRQFQYLDQLSSQEVPLVEMSQAEREQKEAFRAALQQVIFDVCDESPEHLPRVSLECFGSFQSGFASANSDMDLVIVLQDEQRTPACFSLLEDDLPRALEKKLLQMGFGARLLTRTRVPIIKICEKPSENLLAMLREDREKWDALPEEKKYPHLYPEEEVAEREVKGLDVTTDTITQETLADGRPSEMNKPASGQSTRGADATADGEPTIEMTEKITDQPQKPRREKAWTRERKSGPLDFPKDGIGIQCDINFFNPLGLHNTQMLRCYSLSDPRVRPMVLFVKAWAKRRKINSSYSGTLSSYGYVLMVLHYLVNIAQPPVLSNLQMPWRPNPTCTPQGTNRAEVDGWTVDFWRNEREIVQAVHNGQMSPNRDSLGALLTGFFYYYSSMGGQPQFHWMKDVVSLRVEGGLQSKEEKGWTKAVTEEGEGKKVQHRYLFCIEDPFELSHNVARTVTHNGIVAIRDEFRRAKRILHAIALGNPSQDGELFAALVEEDESVQSEQSRPQHVTTTSPNNVHQPQLPQVNHQRPQRVNNSNRGGMRRQNHPARSLDVMDNDAFPSLGGPKPQPKPKRPTKHTVAPLEDSHGFKEISGLRAQQHLEDVRRRKAEEEAEVTAMGAAESVLNGLE
ncbi:PAP/OAS1 substrate-binding domain-containing protein [Acrodontium crateriforme]|uniref:polynucleotide adenylyltransferase n=1 Tax=Acrodontium crateriforme TaxID=150365 RepID=A0AAQ3M642_9PEZI|nr:PAP/OAS1 substrate-binding domain-containing protein [Acrodontium crateriforme]